jgi:hypothetical protein
MDLPNSNARHNLSVELERRALGLDSAPRLHRPVRRTDADLHICSACSSQLVYPVDWAPIDESRWRVELHCPECDLCTEGCYEQAVLDRFDAILDDATESLLDDLSRLQHSNMEDEVDRFVRALEGDLVLPEDF